MPRFSLTSLLHRSHPSQPTSPQPTPAATMPTSASPHHAPSGKPLPAVYVNHGGGPMPLLGRQPDVVASLRHVVELLPRKPTSILMVSAHFEGSPITVMTSPTPGMYYDYGGFPNEAYSIKYPAPLSSTLLSTIENALSAAELPFKRDNRRGYDHGVFVPLAVMFPKADVPLVCVSLPGSLDARDCTALGDALATVRAKDPDCLVVGSGSSFHNMRLFRGMTPEHRHLAQGWDQWLRDTMTTTKGSERRQRCEQWENAPGARLSHPRAEHILPLFVVAVAAGDDQGHVAEPDEPGPAAAFGVPMSQYIFTE